MLGHRLFQYKACVGLIVTCFKKCVSCIRFQYKACVGLITLAYPHPIPKIVFQYKACVGLICFILRGERRIGRISIQGLCRFNNKGVVQN